MHDNNLKHYRMEKGLTQAELADKLGVSKDYISQIERGIKNPGFKLANRISVILGKTIEELFFNNK